MRKTPLLCIILILSAALPLLAAPQQEESLGDLARQLREKSQKDAKKPVKVFTNDNLPQRPPEEAAAAQPVPPPSDKQPSKPAEATAKPDNPPSSQDSSSEPNDKKKTRDYWQAKFKEARQALAQAKEHGQLSEDELNLLQVQQAREMDPALKQDLATKVQDKQSEVAMFKTGMADAQKNLDDLESEFKDSGAPDDWSKTD
jgi:hypothetical protein